MLRIQHLLIAILAMCLAVTASNILVQYHVNWWPGLKDYLTYGAFTYPFAFLVNDLTNRRYGPQMARYVVYAGFAAGLVVSWFLATPRLAIASCAAFLCAQMLDIAVFGPLRRKTWWQAPLAAAISGSAFDTVIFFVLGFSDHFAFLDLYTGYADNSWTGEASLFGIMVPVWFSVGFVDFLIKIAMGVFMLLPYRIFLAIFMPAVYAASQTPQK